MATTTKGVWSLNEVMEQVRKGEWVNYNSNTDPHEIWSWGNNNAGELAINNNISRSSPTQVPGTTWCDVSIGENFLGTKCDGTLWLAGINNYAQIGIDSPSNISSPTQISGTSWCRVQTTSNQSTLFAIRCDGTLWSWGENTTGSLGQNDLVDRSSPTQIPGTTWNDIRSYASHVAALKSDNTLWSWGNNTNGHLGQSDRTHRSSPVQIPGTTWCKVAVGCCFSLALRTDNTLWSWGTNTDGQLGVNDRVHRSSPVQIPGTTWCDIAAGLYSSFALRTDNTLWSFGGSTNGELGANNRISRSSPVQIPGTTWCKLPDGYNHLTSFAIKSDDTLWGWGFNDIGQLGQSDVTSRSSPVQISGQNWKCVYTGSGRVLGARKI